MLVTSVAQGWECGDRGFFQKDKWQGKVITEGDWGQNRGTKSVPIPKATQGREKEIWNWNRFGPALITDQRARLWADVGTERQARMNPNEVAWGQSCMLCAGRTLACKTTSSD